jgi:hypothetical protein
VTVKMKIENLMYCCADNALDLGDVKVLAVNFYWTNSTTLITRLADIKNVKILASTGTDK